MSLFELGLNRFKCGRNPSSVKSQSGDEKELARNAPYQLSNNDSIFLAEHSDPFVFHSSVTSQGPKSCDTEITSLSEDKSDEKIEENKEPQDDSEDSKE